MTDAVLSPKAEILAQQAFQDMARYDLPPTPENFAVFYHYHSGVYPALKTTIDEVVGQGRKVTAAFAMECYQEYLGVYANNQLLVENNKQLEGELKKVMEMLSSALTGSDRFGETLNVFSGQLNTASSLETIRTAVTKVIKETAAIAEENKKLQSDLSETVGQLAEVRTSLDQVHKESQLDPLTEIGNRKFFDREFAQALENVRADGGMLSLLMVDIDHFKKFNDSHGHLIGDQVLRLVARTLVENLKGRDIIARYGGEEFVILLPLTRVQDAERVANQLRATLATKHIKRRGSNEVLGVVTISVGAAEYKAGEDGDTLIARADGALYKAKQDGRNRVVCA
ncbi:MAG: GGDEF domain-containing protein [Alphaproteobacteria bacterium]|nr:GGDEF domain-containing protein [Alphaproteobacteria bacterium]